MINVEKSRGAEEECRSSSHDGLIINVADDVGDLRKRLHPHEAALLSRHENNE